VASELAAGHEPLTDTDRLQQIGHSAGLPDFSWYNICTKREKKYQMTTKHTYPLARKYTKMIINILNAYPCTYVCNVTNIFGSKAISKVVPNWNFLYENIFSGNPGPVA
jgi:hypothetical protein